MKIQSFQSYNTSNTSFGLKIIDQTDGALLSAIRDVKAEAGCGSKSRIQAVFPSEMQKDIVSRFDGFHHPLKMPLGKEAGSCDPGAGVISDADTIGHIVGEHLAEACSGMERVIGESSGGPLAQYLSGIKKFTGIAVAVAR